MLCPGHESYGHHYSTAATIAYTGNAHEHPISNDAWIMEGLLGSHHLPYELMNPDRFWVNRVLSFIFIFIFICLNSTSYSDVHLLVYPPGSISFNNRAI